VIAAQPVITSNDSPADAFCQKQRTDLIIHGRVDRAKQVAGLECEFHSVRIEFVAAHGFDLRFGRAAEDTETNAEKQQNSARTSVLHWRATIGTLDWIAILL
jgi:hypothetical protein